MRVYWRWIYYYPRIMLRRTGYSLRVGRQFQKSSIFILSYTETKGMRESNDLQKYSVAPLHFVPMYVHFKYHQYQKYHMEKHRPMIWYYVIMNVLRSSPDHYRSGTFPGEVFITIHRRCLESKVMTFTNVYACTLGIFGGQHSTTHYSFKFSSDILPHSTDHITPLCRSFKHMTRPLVIQNNKNLHWLIWELSAFRIMFQKCI